MDFLVFQVPMLTVQALLDGLAPKVILESTNVVVLESVSLDILKEYQFNKKNI